MRLVARIDAQGHFVEDVLLEGDEDIPEGCIEERPRDGFYAPRWTGAEWVEGKPAGEMLKAAKKNKVEEFHARAIDELAPLFTEGRGEHELILLFAAHVRRILGDQADPRLAKVEEVGNKALAKRDEVEAATTPEELEAVSWEEPS